MTLITNLISESEMTREIITDIVVLQIDEWQGKKLKEREHKFKTQERKGKEIEARMSKMSTKLILNEILQVHIVNIFISTSYDSQMFTFQSRCCL